MDKGMPMNRAQRVERLVRLNAPCKLVQHEVLMALREYMEKDISVGVGPGLSWVLAAWAIVAAWSASAEERNRLRRQLNALKREAKKKAVPA